MPFFSNKFSLKKTPPRKSPSVSTLHRDLDPVNNQEEFGLNYGQVKVKLGNQEAVFDDGQWVSGDGSAAMPNKELTKLKKEKQKLIEENNFLKFKIEVLLSMLAETTAEVHLQEAEIDELKSEFEKSQALPSNSMLINVKKK